MIVAQRPTSVSLAHLRARIGRLRSPALLDGHSSLGRAGRWSILAAMPRAVFESSNGSGFQISTEETTIKSDGDALDGLARFLYKHKVEQSNWAKLAPDLPFQGGVIGHLSYDLAPKLEAIPRRLAVDSRIPAVRFGFYDTFALVDHVSGQSLLCACDSLNEGAAAVSRRLDDWERQIETEPNGSGPRKDSVAVRADQSQTEYLLRIARAKEYIRAGDIFQVNLSQRFQAPGTMDCLELYERLQSASPAPYGAYLAWDDLAIVSNSPELFYETVGMRIVTRPIKGTRPRSDNPNVDSQMIAELMASSKDKAELTMIVDLERNDLGRVCEFGSVKVQSPRSVESYRNVHHTVATVEGRIRPGVGPIDVVRALFPGGSITGAPKIRAMEIIDELEPSRRGIYTGAIGYWSSNGRSSFNIAIRTIVSEGDRMTYHVGGGIVADSDPEQEYQETLDKGRKLFEALNGTRGTNDLA